MRLTPEAILDLLQRCHLPIPSGLGLVGLRGATADGAALKRNDNAYNEYNDTLVAMDFDAGVIRWHHDYTSGEPGRYWDQHATYSGPNSGAPFTLYCGDVHLVRGTHKGSRALNQASDINGHYPALRDVDQDYRLESSDLFCFTSRDNGINLHWGGYSEAVEAHSSGCHVVQSSQAGQPWTSFISLLWNTFNQQAYYSYQVLDAGWLDDRVERLFFGSRGDAVAAWQQRLNSEGYPCRVDGVFGELTHTRTIQRNRANKSTNPPDQWGIAWAPAEAAVKPPLPSGEGGGEGPADNTADQRLVDFTIGRNIFSVPYTLDGDNRATIRVADLLAPGRGSMSTERWPRIEVTL